MVNKKYLYKLEGSGRKFFTCSEASEIGISRATLSNLTKKGLLERAAHGVYTTTDSFADEMFINQVKAANLIYSHETALFLHELTDRTPDKYSVTVPSRYKPSKRVQEACKIFYIAPSLHLMGCIEVANNMGNIIKTYNLERTICDVLRSRNRMDAQIVLESIKNYAALPNKDLNKLYEYATIFKVTKILRQYLEVLL